MDIIRAILGKLAGRGFGSKLLPLHALVRQAIVQKIFRFNGKASWPVHWTSRVMAPHKIDPGNRFPGLSNGCHIDGRNGIVFGENVWVGPRVTIVSMNHDSSDYTKYLPAEPIVIKKNSWLASNAVILPGVTLGEHTLVAAGAIVTKSFPEGDQVLAGSPARVVKKLSPYTGG